MKTVVLEVSDKSYNDVIKFIKTIPDISYYDAEDDIYTEDDRRAYKIAKKELECGETKSWDDLKKELKLV